jgi:CubicO group peptidase (beta-lactamase class C family)
MKNIYFLFLVIISTSHLLNSSAKANNYPTVSDNTLLTRWVSPVWYEIKPSPTPTVLKNATPTIKEQEIIKKVENIIKNNPVKAFVLMNGNNVVYKKIVSPATQTNKFLGFSIGKTVTSMAVGKAICNGKISMSTRVDSLIPELQGKDLGSSTVKDLLTMSSGTKDPIRNSSYHTLDELKSVNRGEKDLLDMLVRDGTSSFKRGVLSTYIPGEVFLYKGSDVDTLALMVANAIGTSFAEWLQKSVLDPAGIAHSGWQGQDQKRVARAAGSTSLTIDDWGRFALWVKNSSKEKSCFGNYVREAMSTHITNNSKTGKSFKGYGYFIWTDNTFAKDTAWAVGYGGQRIGWDKNSDRMVIVFSNIENYMPEIYKVANLWNKLN